MNRVSTCIVLSVLVLSTICSAVCLKYDGELLSMITDQSEENEWEIEAIDFRQLKDRSTTSGRSGLFEEKRRFCYSEALNVRNFFEVPFPPPKE